MLRRDSPPSDHSRDFKESHKDLYMSNSGLLTNISQAVKLSAVDHPGAKIRLTKKGIEYAKTQALFTFYKELEKLQIEDQQGSTTHMNWSVTSIENHGATMPLGDISLEPTKDVIVWTIWNVGLSLSAAWSIDYKRGWVHLARNGNVKISTKGATFKVIVKVGSDTEGRPSVNCESCTSKLSDMNIKFQGGTSWLINLLIKPLKSTLKKMLQTQMDNIIKNFIDVEIGARLKRIDVTLDLTTHCRFDLSLLSPPEIDSNFVETKHKGIIYWVNNNELTRTSSYIPLDIPPLADISKMFYMWITEFTLNTFSKATKSIGLFYWTFSYLDLPSDKSYLLHTTCDSAVCVGRIIPQIGAACPNCLVQLIIGLTSPPNLTISEKYIIIEVEAEVNVFASDINQTVFHLMTINVMPVMTVSARISDQHLIAEIISYSFQSSMIKSNVGTVNPDNIDSSVELLLDNVIVPKINAFCKAGLTLPLLFVDTSLKLLEGCLLISTDIHIPTENPA